MQIDKAQILELLRSRGQDEQAKQADAELPEKVDVQLLSRFGLDPQQLVSAITEGGLGGALGGLLRR